MYPGSGPARIPANLSQPSGCARPLDDPGWSSLQFPVPSLRLIQLCPDPVSMGSVALE